MPEELEWKTRKERVDRKLKALHPPWKIVKYQSNLVTSSLDCHAVEEYPTESGPADYALFVKGKFLGIIEAKKVKVGPANVLEQAKRYARGATDAGNWHGLGYRSIFDQR
jgi:type I restriction enzyme R subunit